MRWIFYILLAPVLWLMRDELFAIVVQMYLVVLFAVWLIQSESR
jgi:hypothetical protein